MTPGTVTQTVWSLTEDSGDRVVQDQAGLRLRRGRDTIPIVNVTTAATSRGPTHKFAQFLQPLKVCSNRADRNSNLFIERTRPLRQTGGERVG